MMKTTPRVKKKNQLCRILSPQPTLTSSCSTCNRPPSRHSIGKGQSCNPLTFRVITSLPTERTAHTLAPDTTTLVKLWWPEQSSYGSTTPGWQQSTGRRLDWSAAIFLVRAGQSTQNHRQKSLQAPHHRSRHGKKTRTFQPLCQSATRPTHGSTR